MSDAIKRPRGAIQSVRVPLSRPSLCDELSYLLMPWLVLVLDACLDTSMLQMTSLHPDGNPQRRDGPPRAAARRAKAVCGVSQSNVLIKVGEPERIADVGMDCLMSKARQSRVDAVPDIAPHMIHTCNITQIPQRLRPYSYSKLPRQLAFKHAMRLLLTRDPDARPRNS